MASFVYIANADESLIVFGVSATNFVNNQMYVFLRYAGLMVINSILFLFIATNYKFVDRKN